MILAPLQIVVGYPFLARRFRRIPLCDASAVEQACERALELAADDRRVEPAAIFFAFAERRAAFPFARRLMAAHLAMTQARVNGMSLRASHQELNVLFLDIAQRRRTWAEVRAWFEPRLVAR